MVVSTLDSDAGNAVKPGLIIPLRKLELSAGPGAGRVGFTATYDFVLEAQP
jgi:hypothetical protein